MVGEVTVSAVDGRASIGFLLYNSHPAEGFWVSRFAGFGAQLALWPWLLNRIFVYCQLSGRPSVGGRLSVILQMGSYKLRKARVFSRWHRCIIRRADGLVGIKGAW